MCDGCEIELGKKKKKKGNQKNGRGRRNESINNLALTTFIDSKRKKCLKSCHVRSHCSSQRKCVEHLRPGKYYPQRVILSG